MQENFDSYCANYTKQCITHKLPNEETKNAAALSEENLILFGFKSEDPDS